MRLVGFQVFHYRSIVDSGWVTVGALTAIVGQNESGKSSLLAALYKFNSRQGDSYDLDLDWPVDLWSERDRDAVVCLCRFRLSRDELAELVAKSCADKAAAAARARLAGIDGLVVSVAKTYRNKFQVSLGALDVAGIDLERAGAWILAGLPQFVLMEETAIFAGRADLDSLQRRLGEKDRARLDADERTVMMMLDLAGLDPTELFSADLTARERRRRAVDTAAGSQRLTQLFAPLWRQRPIGLHLRLDGPSLELCVEDQGQDREIPLKERSRGFQWFLSFVFRLLHARRAEFDNCVLLLDEPGIHLHQVGHPDLMIFLQDLALDHSVIITTHLASMIDLTAPERVRVMEIVKGHGRVARIQASGQRAPMMVIEGALGIAEAQRQLLPSRRSLVVAGVADALLVEQLAAALARCGEAGLAERIQPLPAAGTLGIPFLAGYLAANGCPAAVLLPSDGDGRKVAARLRETARKKAGRGTYPSQPVLNLADFARTAAGDAGIEDLLPAELYLDAVAEVVDFPLSPRDLPALDEAGRSGLRQRVAAALKSHGRLPPDGLAEDARLQAALTRRLLAVKDRAQLGRGAFDRARRLIAAINKAFG